MTVREALATLAAELPADTCVPVPAGLLRVLLGPSGASADASTSLLVDLTVPRTAELLGWRPSTIRQWVENGLFPGSYKIGRAWRIPVSGVDAFQANSAKRAPRLPTCPSAASRTPAFDAALSARKSRRDR